MMTPNEAIDLVRDAILMSLIVAAPLLLVGMVVGLGIGLIQALTQIQDQTVSTVPKLVAMTIAIIICLPWLTDRMLEYSRNLYREIPPHMSQR
ncbi:MAG: flagellar biosynthesis protein FliQ [Pirellula sp.]|nr:flagellar biosynthesis protein FliQ [Pirellula sp.]